MKHLAIDPNEWLRDELIMHGDDLDQIVSDASYRAEQDLENARYNLQRAIDTGKVHVEDGYRMLRRVNSVLDQIKKNRSE